MKLSQPVKILIGLATLWMMIYPLLFLAVWLFMALGMGPFGSFLSQSMPEEGMPAWFMLPFMGIFPLHCLTIVIQMVLMAFYLIHVIKNTAVSETIRIILGVGAFFMPYIAMPVYYYICIWRDEPPEWARPPVAAGTIPPENIEPL